MGVLVDVDSCVSFRSLPPKVVIVALVSKAIVVVVVVVVVSAVLCFVLFGVEFG